MFRRLTVTVLGLGLAWPFMVGAQALSEEEDLALIYGDKTTISIATGSKQTLRRAPSVATVITAADIAAMGARDLDEVLETVPGMHVTRSASFYFSIYGIRGIVGSPNNPQVLMLQNGIPTHSIFRGDKGQSWGGLPLENIARIEIMRGPGSALYGADAFSGVINIITKTAADTPGTEFGVRVGSFSTREAWVQHGGKHGPIDVAAYLRVGATDGIHEVIKADAQTQRDALFGTQASLAPGALNTGYDAVDASVDFGHEKWRLRVGYKLRDNVGTGAGVSYALDPVGQEKSERITADISWNDPRFAQNWGVGVTGSYLHHLEDASNYNLSPPGTRFPTGLFPNGMIGSPGRWEEQLRLSAHATYTGFSAHSLRLGLGYDNLDMYETRTRKNFLLSSSGLPIPTGLVIDYAAIQPHLTPHVRTNSYLYTQDEWNFAKDWTLTAGLRHDSYSDFGGTTNPRLALVWDAALDLTAKLLWGRAFRAPAFLEQYSINPVSNGNPDLKPETIETSEAAFSWQARRDTQVNLSLFRYRMRDTIRIVPNAVLGTGSTFQNTGAQHGSGLELEAVWDASRSLRFSGHYAYQKSIDEATRRDAGYLPHHHWYGRADWRFSPGWLLGGQVNHVADRRRAAGDTRPPIADDTTVDLTLRSERGRSAWNFAVSVRNLFDADLREPSLTPGSIIPNDLPLAGRTLYLQATHGL